MSWYVIDPQRIGLAFLIVAVVAYWIWQKRFHSSRDLKVIFFAALAGALIGAKAGYLIVDGWGDWAEPNRWLRLATGKTILGALLGGFISVEIAKKILNYTKVTGDDFAVMAPIGIAIGRVGCLTFGCCPGIACEAAWYTIQDANGLDRWPAVSIEILFNLAFVLCALLMRKRCVLQGQLFHLYMVTYGVFRLAHEPLRATSKLHADFSGYQILALLLLMTGLAAGWRRARRQDQFR